MKKIICLSLLALALQACAPINLAGNGSDTQGNPVTSKVVQTSVDAKTFNLDVKIYTGRGNICKSNQNLTRGEMLWNLKMECQGGVTGTATWTADYINLRDTIIYRLSNGEKGRITIGASSLQTSQY